MGEFGWEVAQWVPWVRALLHSKPEYREHNVCLTVHQDTVPLYKKLAIDFPNLFLQQVHLPEGRPDMNRRICPKGKGLKTPLTSSLLYEKTIDPQKLRIAAHKNVPVLVGPKQYEKYATQKRSRVDEPVVCFHARAVNRHTERNYKQWDILTREMFKTEGVETAYWIGSKSDWISFQHRSQDLRGLMRIMVWIRNVEPPIIGIGASSGPMHLLQHCGIPCVVWSGNHQKDRARYEEIWNPFEAPVEFIPDWNPAPDDIISAYRMLKRRIKA